MAIRNRVWNVAIGMGITATLTFMAICGWFVLQDKMTGAEFGTIFGPLVGMWAGGAIALLRSESGVDG